MSLTTEQNNYVLELYGESGNSRTKAAELFEEKFGCSVSVFTIKNKWKNAGYELNPHGGNRGLTDKQVRELHGKYDGNVEEMLRELGRESSASLVERCKKLDLEVFNIPKAKIKKRESEPFPGYIV